MDKTSFWANLLIGLALIALSVPADGLGAVACGLGGTLLVWIAAHILYAAKGGDQR